MKNFEPMCQDGDVQLLHSTIKKIKQHNQFSTVFRSKKKQLKKYLSSNYIKLLKITKKNVIFLE